MAVEPQEGETRPSHRAAEHHKFSGSRNVVEEEVRREVRAAHAVGEDAKRRTHHYAGEHRKAIQAVSEIHGVTRPHENEVREDDEAEHAERERNLTEERDREVEFPAHRERESGPDPLPHQGEGRGVSRRLNGERQIHRDDDADQGLPAELLAGAHAVRVVVHDLAVIVRPADPAVTEGHQEHHPDIAV